MNQGRTSSILSNQPTATLAVSADQSARLVGVSKRTWWRLVASKKAPPGFKLGARRVWRVEDLRQFVANEFKWEGVS